MMIGYMAASADGFVAAPDGSVDFLHPYETVDYGYEAFLASIDVVAMGRNTYDAIMGFETGWPYGNRPAYILTSRALDDDAPEAVTRWDRGLDALAMQTDAHRVWVVGGPRVQGDALARGLIDELHLFIVPVLLGTGVPLMPAGYEPVTLALRSSRSFANGMAHLHYAREDA